MSENPVQQYSKNDSVDLRMIFLGDIGVGKKSLINRFKYINSSEINQKRILPCNQVKQSKKPRRINYTKDEKRIVLIVCDLVKHLI